MKAVVKYKRGRGFVELRDVPEPKIKDDQALIEVKAASVCGSDIHIYHDEHPYWPPVVMGHEFSGAIVETGPRVTGWKPGDKVVSETRAGTCRLCRYCRTGWPQNGRLNLLDIITRKAHLEDWAEVFEDVENSRAIKAILYPQ